MKASTTPEGKTGLLVTCFCAVLPVLGVTPALADVYVHGGSHTVIEQSGGSRSRVTRFHDGHEVVTTDGSNTDVTVQRRGDHQAPGERWLELGGRARRWEAGLPPPSSYGYPGERGALDCVGSMGESDADAFRQMMYERMRGHGVP